MAALLCLLCGFFHMKGQEIIFKMQVNPVLTGVRSETISKFQKHALTGDTLKLPFFEDFSQLGIYPKFERWGDFGVYINNHFSINPITQGVASFDNLDIHGFPYRGINNSYNSSDTLTSQPLDLATTNFARDSVYLSFYLEAQGLDPDPLSNLISEPQDSMFVEFYNKSGVWVKVWRKAGKGLPKDRFIQYMIPVLDSAYFHSGFRFRFMNFSKQTGNANHWHLDYIYLNKQRRWNDTSRYDMALTGESSTMLKRYHHMPWWQFRPWFRDELNDSLFHTFRNIDTFPRLFEYSHFYRDKDYRVISPNQKNIYPSINPRSVVRTGFPLWQGAWLNPTDTDSVVVNRLWKIDFAGDQHKMNDTFSAHTIFQNYLAWDDGTAEGGYGIENVPEGGKVAQRFFLNKADSLWAIGIFFNQSHSDVHGKPVELAIWKKITTGTNAEELVKTISLDQPEYRTGINRFAEFVLDTPIYLDSGVFYIGWIQKEDFVLNVGQDFNYSVKNGFKVNKNILYNVQNRWYSTTQATGALMIRPYLGKTKVFPLHADRALLPSIASIQLFPNPAATNSNISISGLIKNSRYMLYNQQGSLLQLGQVGPNHESITTPNAAGIYYICLYQDGAFIGSQRFVVLP